VLARLGQIEMEAGDTAAAAGRFAEASELAPGWPMVWLLRAQLLLRAGEPERARPFLERAAALDPAGPEGAQARRWLSAIGR
jgi:predicted Zn-dependent protease